jgi:ATP-binding cassette subfamily F protein 3
MALVSFQDVAKGYGMQTVLDGATFAVGVGERVGIVGPNGCGKTTVLRLMVGLELPDRGRVAVLPGTTIGYLPQEVSFGEEGSVLEVAMASVPRLVELQGELRRLEAAMGDATDADLESLTATYAERLEEFDGLGGYDFEARAKAVLAGLGFRGDELAKPTGVLSGGQRTRLCLARLLLQEPDLLCLDEPTNHLDIEACEWLEEYLSGWKGSVVVVSHDRYFLDRVVQKVVDLERAAAGGENPTLTYRGNYTAYVAQKELALQQQAEAYERQQEEIARLEAYIRRYKAGNRATMAKSREKALARIQRISRPQASRSIHFQVLPAGASGRIAIELRQATKAYGERVLFRDLNLVVERGDRVGLVGPNGAGKTTLLRVIFGEEELTSGSVVLGHNVSLGYLRQSQEDLGEENTVLDEILLAGDLDAGEARSLLARFLFRGEDVYKPVGSLSGGERSRLVLAKLMVASPNVLLLDEPTNHLDIPSRQALEDALRAYTGALVVASHDRYLLNALVSRIVQIAPAGVTVFEGGYEQFRAATAPKPAPQPSRRRTQGRLQRRPAPPKSESPAAKLKRLEDEIAQKEARLAELTQLLGSGDTYAGGGVQELLREYEELNARLPSLYSEWEALAELVPAS